MSDEKRVLYILEPQDEPDVIECDGKLYVPDRECEFIPSAFETQWDEDDRCLRIGKPSEDCDSFMCSECEYELMYDYTGEYSWFDSEYPYEPHGLRYCPGCGARVLFPPSWLDTKEVEE